jgi:signal transduction histidine kinase
MPSIRRSLLGYLLLLLVLAFGGVGVLVYQFASAAMHARLDAETRRIEHAYQAQEKKVLDQFDADILVEAKSLSRVYEKEAERMLAWRQPPQNPPPPRPPGRPEPRPEPRPIEPPILPTVEEVQLFHLRTKLFLQLGTGAGVSGFSQPVVTWASSDARGLNPAWIDYDTPRLRTRIVEAVKESFTNDEHAAFCQFDFVFTTPYLAGRTITKANPSKIGQDLPFGTAELDALKDRENWTADVELPGKGKYRRVIVSHPRPLLAWVPGTPGQVVYNTPTRGRLFRTPDLAFRTYIQSAHPYSELHSRLAEDQRSRDEQLASVRNETRDQLAQLRTRLGLIGAGTFLALVVGGWLIVARGLFPMTKLSEAVSLVSEKDFRLPIEPADLSRELAPIHARLTQTLDQLRRAFAREKQSVADISHELRTPIASLQATLDVALRKPRTPDQYRATLEDCRAICKQLGQLVERIMVLASLDAGTARTVSTRTDAADVAAGCAAVIRPLAASHGLEFSSRVAAPLELDTDPDKLREVLVNLLHNAVEYNSPGGRIELAGRRENGSVVLEVRDTGIGMAADVKDRIFERFFRADASRQATGVHAGLGLAIVKEYVERLGGRIAVESEPGSGSTFRVTLPAPADVPAEPEFPAEHAADEAVPSGS